MQDNLEKLYSKLGLNESKLSLVMNLGLASIELPSFVDREITPGEVYDWVLGFYMSQDSILNEISLLNQLLSSKGELWLCWPKKASGISSDLNDRIVRGIGLGIGLVDIKVAAINETWSGLKFVARRSKKHI